MGMEVHSNHRLFLIISMILVTSTYVIAHEWMAPKQYSDMKNPIVQGADSIARGKEIFLDNCAACHGENGKGLKAEETNLEKSTPNLLLRLATHSDGDFFWKIQEGRSEMPSFKDVIDEESIWDVINFIEAAE
jgi:mono/diheme cytochrome c family protein